jgi:hypothetical protein
VNFARDRRRESQCVGHVRWALQGGELLISQQCEGGCLPLFLRVGITYGTWWMTFGLYELMGGAILLCSCVDARLGCVAFEWCKL